MLGYPLLEGFIDPLLPAWASRLEIGQHFWGESQGSRNLCGVPLWSTFARATHLTLFPKGRHSLGVVWVIGTLGVDHNFGGRCDRLFDVRLNVPRKVPGRRSVPGLRTGPKRTFPAGRTTC